LTQHITFLASILCVQLPPASSALNSFGIINGLAPIKHLEALVR